MPPSVKQIRLDVVPEEFYKSVEKDQRKLLQQLNKLVKQLDVKDGQILISTKNIAQVNRIMAKFSQIFAASSYQESVAEFMSEFDVQRDLIRKLIKDEFGQVPTKAAIEEMFEENKAATLEALAGRSAIDAEFFQPVQNVLRQNVGSGASLADTIVDLQRLVVGDERNGRLLGYTKTIAKDAFAQSDRNYTFTASADLGVQFFLYSGGLVEDSREFCVHRNNHYYHRKEIQKWVTSEGQPKPSGTWQGMIPGTNKSTIFINAGGYNCNHSILPLSAKAVPKDVLSRNIASGNWSPTDRERKALGV